MAMTPHYPGDIIDGRYEVVRMIGRGAMADVYQARDPDRDREVALKIMNHAQVRDAESISRFHLEAQVQEILEHRNVAALYGDGVTASGQPYLVVELLRGRSLRTVLRKEERVDVVRASSYCWQALNGLTACHGAGVLHRDLKPANIMLQPSQGPVERVVLIDFGFASLQGGPKLTAQGYVVGSLSYLAPERLRGEGGDKRSDVYAMGIVFYELLIGDPPFVADDDFDLINKHMEEIPLALSQVAPELEIPAAINTVIQHSLAKNAADRPQSAAAMADELERATRGVS
jgi:serine/threonine protein kinase